MIEEQRREADGPTLVLDAGDALLGESLALRSEGRVIVAAMNAMGYDAMAVGLMDLAKGVEVLLARSEEARFAVLSANIVRREGGETLVRPYTLIERGGVRFGIIGVSEPEVMQAPGAADLIQVLDPVEALARLLPEVQAQSDVVIVVSHLGLEGDRALASEAPGIDIIVGGRSKQLLLEPDMVGGTAIVQMGYDGEWLGKLVITLQSDGRIDGHAVERITLGPEFAESPVLKGIVADHAQRYPGD
ncbi:MAG: bifunctional metallophosphatase/5'-nucleotidase [Anaerolineae bacterium]